MSLMDSSPLCLGSSVDMEMTHYIPAPLNSCGNNHQPIKVDSVGSLGKTSESRSRSRSCTMEFGTLALFTLFSSFYNVLALLPTGKGALSLFVLKNHCTVDIHVTSRKRLVCAILRTVWEFDGCFTRSFTRSNALNPVSFLWRILCFINGVFAFRRVSPSSGRGTLQGRDWELLLQHDHAKVRGFLLWGMPGECQQLQELWAVPEDMFQNPKYVL